MKEKFSIKARLKSFKYAFEGLIYFARTVQNGWVHMLATCIAIFGGIYFELAPVEWLWIVSAICLVFICELFNTSIEKIVDKASPEQSELARRSKDLAAGAVLVSAFFAIIVAGIIFYPYFTTS